MKNGKKKEVYVNKLHGLIPSRGQLKKFHNQSNNFERSKRIRFNSYGFVEISFSFQKD